MVQTSYFQGLQERKGWEEFPILKICLDYSFRSDLKLMSFCKLFQLPTFNLPYTLSRREGSMKCYAFFSCFQERKMNCFSIFTKEIVMADFSYLLKKTHCLMLLSFVSRQRLDL